MAEGLKILAQRIVRETCGPNGCAYASRNKCMASRSAEDIVRDIGEDGEGCAVAAEATESVIIQLQPGIMTTSGFTPLNGPPVNAKEHIPNCTTTAEGRVVFRYPAK